MYKKIVFFLSLCLFINCSDTSNLSHCNQNFQLTVFTDLNNSELINALTPGGFAEIGGGRKGLLLFNKNGSEFVAFDRTCPSNDCTTAMSFNNRLLQCVCDKSKYSVDFGGAPQTEGFDCPAIEYQVTKNGTSIRISNF